MADEKINANEEVTCAKRSRAAIVIPVVCSYCGDELDGEELESPYKDESGDIICDDCYHDHYEGTCDLCQNIVQNTELESKPGELFAVWSEASAIGAKDLKPGYYRVKEWPMYVSDMLSASFFSESIEKIMDLDEEGQRAAQDAWTPCGKLCAECRKRLEDAIKV